jgi:MFS transporter, BCD family, chlorophyll transporter
MTKFGLSTVHAIISLGPRFMPFADAATPELPMNRLLRLSLFQVSVGMAMVLMTGTLNRVMIVELGLSPWFVALMVSMPLFIAPFRVLIGHKSDQHRSAFGWRRAPFIWYGTIAQWGGLAIMPFALLVMTQQLSGPSWVGPVAAGASFLIVGLGFHMTQTAGLALATDLATPQSRPRVVALLYMMLVVGMFIAALIYGWLLRDFTPLRLIQVVQGSAVVTLLLNIFALWKQEARDRKRALSPRRDIPFSESWRAFVAEPGAARMLVAVGVGSIAFAMQDILLEPYGGAILKLTVSGTTLLTALAAMGNLIGFLGSAHYMKRDWLPASVAAIAALVGIIGFTAVIFAAPLQAPNLFRVGVALVGLGAGAYAHAMLVGVMNYAGRIDAGMALGAWGSVQATAAGIGILAGGVLQGLAQRLFSSEGFADPSVGYSFVYHLEIALLFVSLVVLGPLARKSRVLQSNEAPVLAGATGSP